MTDLDSLRELALSRGVTAFGVADLDRLRDRFPDFSPGDAAFHRAVVLGVRLEDAVLDELADHPTALYLHHYRQANYFLDRVAFEVALRLQTGGAEALAVPASQIVAENPMRGRLSHKLLGWDAGIGWIGRSALLVHPEFGSRMRYVSVLTAALLPAGSPVARDCGSCRRCIAACPAGAICDDSHAFDLDACYAKLSEFRRIGFVGQHICGLCLKACGGAQWRSAASGATPLRPPTGT